MKSFIKDKKLRLILKEIEAFLGYKITAKPLTAEESKTLVAGIQPLPSGWIFLYSPKDVLTQNLLCHELMHLVLLVQGWPIFYSNTAIPTDQPTSDIVTLLITLVQHEAVYIMESELGYNSLASDPEEMALRPLCNAVQHMKDTSPHILAPYLLQALLFPPNDLEQQVIIAIATQYAPRSLELASTLFKKFKEYSPVTADNCVKLLHEMFKILKIDKAHGSYSIPDQFNRDFFKQIIAKVSK